MNTLKKFDVSIVGFGPTGALLALLLARLGLNVFLIDKTQEIYDKPRAIALDHEVMRTLQNLQIADLMVDFVEPFTDSHYLGVEGQLIKMMSTPAPPFIYGHVPALVFNQPCFEKVLRQVISKHSNIHVELNAELIDLSQQEGEVHIQVDQEHSNAHSTHQTVVSKYLVGCDGASSFVRKALHTELEDLGFNEPWLVVDLLVDPSIISNFPQTSMQYCDPQRPITLVIGPKNHRRFEIALNQGETADDFKDEVRIWNLLSRWVKPHEATLWRHACYEFHALVAQHWRVGRVLIAGDAAHQQPPFLGQGMCQGIRDVVNLSWKLQQAIQKPNSDHVLNSYESERKGHVKALTSRIIEIGKIVGQRDLKLARERDLHLLNEAKGLITPTPRQDVQPALQDGFFSHRSHPKLGTLFPQPVLVMGSTEALMDDVMGTGWRVVYCSLAFEVESGTTPSQSRSARLADNEMLTSLLDELEIKWFEFEYLEQDPKHLLKTWFTQAQANWALLRPDHYIYAVGREQLALAEELVKLKKLLGY